MKIWSPTVEQSFQGILHSHVCIHTVLFFFNLCLENIMTNWYHKAHHDYTNTFVSQYSRMTNLDIYLLYTAYCIIIIIMHFNKHFL